LIENYLHHGIKFKKIIKGKILIFPGSYFLLAEASCILIFFNVEASQHCYNMEAMPAV
jgi:hypothetical protein